MSNSYTSTNHSIWIQYFCFCFYGDQVVGILTYIKIEDKQSIRVLVEVRVKGHQCHLLWSWNTNRNGQFKKISANIAILSLNLISEKSGNNYLWFLASLRDSPQISKEILRDSPRKILSKIHQKCHQIFGWIFVRNS